MRKTIVAVAAMCLVLSLAAQGPQSATQVIENAAAALGGKARLLELKSLKIEGYGQIAYQNGGGNISSSPDAPQKWIDVPEYEKIIDFPNRRMRVRQRQHNQFVFGTRHEQNVSATFG